MEEIESREDENQHSKSKLNDAEDEFKAKLKQSDNARMKLKQEL